MAIALTLRSFGEALVCEERPIPAAREGQLVLRVRACGVCRTDLHLIDRELPDARLPIVPGHEIVGEVVACGAGVDVAPGSRLGVPWLGYTCGTCSYCREGRENLCEVARFTGCHLDGGYAEYAVADARYCFELPDAIDDVHAAPLLCAGLIGYRSLRMARDPRRLGIYGFGAAAHIVGQVAAWEGREVYAFTRPGDTAAQSFALDHGAQWSAGSDEASPEPLDAAIIFAPVGALIPTALRSVRKGGVVVCGGIHMSDVPEFPYALLWGERQVRSVANLTRRDGIEFLELAPRVPVRTEVVTYPLSRANEALSALRHGTLRGAAVLVPEYDAGTRPESP